MEDPRPTPVSHRVQKRRDALRAAGLRPVRIWVPDTRRPGFAAECARQAAVVAGADPKALAPLMDTALADLTAGNEARHMRPDA